jgi:hypothetical protein
MSGNGFDDTENERGGWFGEALAAVRELAAEVAELKQTTEEPLTDALAQFLTAQYVLAAKAAVRQASGGPLDLKTLRALCGDAVALRRGDQAAARLRFDRERLQLSREAVQKRMEEEFEKRLKDPKVRERFTPRATDDQMRKAVIRLVDQIMLGTPLEEVSSFDEKEMKATAHSSGDGQSADNPNQTP